MNIENVVIARKWSGLEWTAQKHGISLEQAMLAEGQLGIDTDIINGHLRQQSALEKFLTSHLMLRKFPLLVGDDLDKALLFDAELVIVLGGDNYFQHVSHSLSDQLVVGINNDPAKSNGGFARFSMENFSQHLDRILQGNFDVEEWTRLHAMVNGEVLPHPAISEVYVGSRYSSSMARYVLRIGSEQEIQKSSGIVIATGYGSSEGSWYNNLTEDCFSPRLREAAFIVREPNLRGKYSLRHGDLMEGESLYFQWLGHDYGSVELDAGSGFIRSIQRGDEVAIEISDKPLKVVVP